MELDDLLVALTISNHPVAGSIIVSASRASAMDGLLLEMDPLDPYRLRLKSQILLFWEAVSRISCALSLSIDRLEEWNINLQNIV